MLIYFGTVSSGNIGRFIIWKETLDPSDFCKASALKLNFWEVTDEKGMRYSFSCCNQERITKPEYGD